MAEDLPEGNAATLARLISTATEALSHLDASALEEIGRRAEALAGLDLGTSGVSSRAMVPVLEHKFRLFAALMNATGDNLATLRRAESQRSYGAASPGDRSFGRQGFGADQPLPPHPYQLPRELPPRGLFESFGLYGEDEAVDSIWPRGRRAQAQQRSEARSRKAADPSAPGRT